MSDAVTIAATNKPAPSPIPLAARLFFIKGFRHSYRSGLSFSRCKSHSRPLQCLASTKNVI
jgi:hypothetical protein